MNVDILLCVNSSWVTVSCTLLKTLRKSGQLVLD